MQRTLLDEQQVSKVLRLKVNTLRKRRCRGLPPRFLKVGGKVFYDQADLETYLTSCVREPKPLQERKR